LAASSRRVAAGRSSKWPRPTAELRCKTGK
jgi:hypothetical protein